MFHQEASAETIKLTSSFACCVHHILYPLRVVAIVPQFLVIPSCYPTFRVNLLLHVCPCWCQLKNLHQQFNGLDWSLLVKHLEFEDGHNSWLYWFTNPLEFPSSWTPSSRGLVKQYNQELCISSNYIRKTNTGMTVTTNSRVQLRGNSLEIIQNCRKLLLEKDGEKARKWVEAYTSTP